MGEPNLIGDAVPWIAAPRAETARHAYYDRCAETTDRAPAQGAAVIQLLHAGIRVLTKLNFGNRTQPGQGHAYGIADNSLFGQAGVEDASCAKLRLESHCGGMYTTLHADVFAKDEQAGVQP